MNHLDVTGKKYPWHHRRRRFDYRNSMTARRGKRHRRRIDMHRPQIIKRFCPDCHALRTWEDDGGGQAHLR